MIELFRMDNQAQKLFRKHLMRSSWTECSKLFPYVPNEMIKIRTLMSGSTAEKLSAIRTIHKLLGAIQMNEDEYTMYIVANLPKLAQNINVDIVKRRLDEKLELAELKHLIDTVIQSKTSTSIRNLTYYWLESSGTRSYRIKEEFNRIAWGVPSDESIAFIKRETLKHFVKFPESRLIDLGAGSGTFSLLLKDAGIPEDRIVAIDFESSMCESGLEMFPITKIQCHSNIDSACAKKDTEEVVKHIQPNDVVLIVWGYCLWETFDACLKLGIKTFIVQGEPNEIGCTFPVDYIQQNDEWTTTLIKLPTPYGIYEHVAVWNKKI